jgi:orotate phosphoribosyltransferase
MIGQRNEVISATVSSQKTSAASLQVRGTPHLKAIGRTNVLATPQDRERLKQILKTHSVRFGDFILASGQRSNLYVDCRLTTLRAEAMPLIGRLFVAKIRELGWTPDVVGGLTLGADPVVTAVARESLDSGSVINAFLIRKEAKKHGRQKFIEGLDDPAGKKAVIVDDVCTTGGSTIKAIEASREAGIEVLGAICLVDREQGGGEAIELQHHCPFARIFTMSELLDR